VVDAAEVKKAKAAEEKKEKAEEEMDIE